jgi:hypothetical protein
MKQLTLEIQDDQYEFFMQLVNRLPFVKVAEDTPKKLTKKQKEFVENLKSALKEVELHQEGKIQLKTLQEVIDEL